MTPSADLLDNLRSAPVLCFALGILARVLRSDLRLPDALSQALSVYLLLAIGLKGGAALSVGTPGLLAGVIATLAVAVTIPLVTFTAARRLARFDRGSAASLAAHYGSTSAVTFLATLAYLEAMRAPVEGFLTALLAVMEVPAILIALLLAGGSGPDRRGDTLREVLTGKTLVLLLGGMVVGALAGHDGHRAVAPFFVHPFQGVLCLFLLDLGRVAAERLGDLGRQARFLVPFGLVAPVVFGSLGTLAGHLAGLSPGGATALGALSGSASYIAAPAAMRTALPETNHGPALTASLGVTFPFNLLFGIPLLHALALQLAGGGTAS